MIDNLSLIIWLILVSLIFLFKKCILFLVISLSVILICVCIKLKLFQKFVKMSDDFIVLALVNDHFIYYPIPAQDYHEAIRLFIDSIVPYYDNIRFCGCWLFDEFVVNIAEPCPVQTAWNNNFYIKTY